MNRTSRRSKLLLITGFLTAGAVALAGCSSTRASSSASTKPSKVTLVVYLAQGYDHAMTAAFTKATGIPVKLDDNSTGPLLTQIEASKNNPNWGLLWVDGATAFAGLDQQGLLQKGFEPSVKWDTLGQSSAGIGAVLGDKKLTVKYLDPVTLLPSAIGIDAKAPAAERAEAEKFITFVLSPAGQKVMQSGDPTGDSLYYPVLQGVSPLPALPSLSGVKTQTINPYTWGTKEATVNTWFDGTIVR
jgi:ABC-type Fe3+ transport system substrate-binding protein